MTGHMRGYLHASKMPTATFDQPKRRTMPRNRTCAAEDCGTRLSVYNPTPFCCLHGGLERTAPVVDGYARCRVCCRVLPATTDYFHRQRGESLHKACKDCRNLYKRGHDYRTKPDADEKTCPRCGKTKPLNSDYWYCRDDTRHMGWSSRCRACMKRAARERARELAAARRAEVAT